jgi:hypothetical protein
MQPVPLHLRRAVVACSRNGDGRNTFPVELGAITGACIAAARGGDWKLLPAPALAVYAPAELVPAELRTGRGHVGGNLLVVVERDGSDPAALAWLERAELNRHTVEHAQRLARRADRRSRRRSRHRPPALRS